MLQARHHNPFFSYDGTQLRAMSLILSSGTPPLRGWQWRADLALCPHLQATRQSGTVLPEEVHIVDYLTVDAGPVLRGRRWRIAKAGGAWQIAWCSDSALRQR